jgi:DNA polymerase-3 subunit gamma/tau
MSEHTALYRKYRPQSFAEVRDQDHIVSVLEGAIKKGVIPHAILFSGTRGTGKTTMARLFASAVGAKGVDVYEIDAASNRGIDDIRELREAVHTAPFESPYKVYIIDEVHMLTKEAFNALLKTLEEPPAHVIFILATTEEEKLLDTILSRCQVFRFRSPSRAVLAATVVDVASKEGYTLSPDVADVIAAAADGSFRDALGITQKVILASGETIGTVDDVAHIIGAPKQSLLLALLAALSAKDTTAALGVVGDIAASHTDPKLFFRLLLEIIRAVMLVRHHVPQADTLLGTFSPDVRAAITTYEATPGAINSHLLQRLIAAAIESQRSPLPFLPLEVVIADTGALPAKAV